AGERLLAAAQQAFFGPFRVSLMLDSNGSNTTAVAAVEKMVQAAGEVRGERVLIVAGTGPVGIRAAGLFARAGAEVVITSRKPEAGERARDLVVQRFGGTVRAITLPDPSQAIRACERATLLLNAGPAGVMLVPKQAWAKRPGLKVVRSGLFARSGAEVVITSRKPEAGERARDLVVQRFGGTVRAITLPDPSQAIRACERATLLLNAGPAGVMLVPKQAWAKRPGLKVVAD